MQPLHLSESESLRAGFFPSCPLPLAVIMCLSWLQLLKKNSCMVLSSSGSPQPWVPGIILPHFLIILRAAGGFLPLWFGSLCTFQPPFLLPPS